MSFDADTFLNAAVTGSNSTKVIPCPQGEFFSVIEKIGARQVQSKDGSETRVVLEVTWLVEDDGAKAATGRDSVSVKQGIFLDLDPNGGIDTAEGKNVGLGRLREALGLNDPSAEFSFNMLPGRAAKIQVTHRDDPKDAENKFADVRSVAAA
jgi:hypothetical protein